MFALEVIALPTSTRFALVADGTLDIYKELALSNMVLIIWVAVNGI